MVATRIEESDFQKLRQIFASGGTLSSQFAEYEERPQQLLMAQYVLASYTQGGCTMIEAGTGTGKSLAYLIPALLWAKANNEKVIIATHTINLQEQLLSKDIPMARAVLDWDFSSCLVKGWSNYVCLSKLSQAPQEFELFESEFSREIGVLSAWAETTEDGSRSDLPIEPSQEVWEAVCAESDLCTRAHCPYFSRCFYFTARREMQKATVLLVNHHMLFADMALRRVLGFDTDKAVLPRYYHVIFDEAHHIEDVATSYLGAEVSPIGMAKLLNRIHRTSRNSGSGGLVGRLLRAIGPENGEAQTLIQRLQWDIPAACRRLYDETQHLFGLLRPFCSASAEETLVLNAQSSKDTIYDINVFDSYSRWQKAIGQLLEALGSVVEELGDIKDEMDEGESLLMEARAFRNRVHQYKETLRFLYDADKENYVYWLELGGKNRSLVKFCAAPIVIAEELQSALLQYLISVVFTSATLTASNKFDYMINSLGLKPSDNGIPVPEPLNGVVIESPFDYENQALLCVPQDLPEPGSGEAVGSMTAYLLDVLDITRGRAFVLFTSYRLLDQVYLELNQYLPAMGIKLLRQGHAPRAALLKAFMEEPNCVLLGTDSFWEGVDVPGEALSCVVITKLPFKVPTEPVTSARIEFLESRGRNSFREYMLPQAVIKFKQGFGRLIRTKSDKGVVVVLDPRIVRKHYGRQFLNSLPGCTVATETREATLKQIERWLK